jgi:hypothetical protein
VEGHDAGKFGSTRRVKDGPSRWLSASSGVLAALLGAALVIGIFGLASLNPWNQGWLLAGPLGPDPVQLWLGWTYFKSSPWLLPPGANPAYGLELGTAIYFADAIPLLALLLKALRGLGDIPQYVGPWLLACGILQGIMGWRLIGLATSDPLARLCGAGLMLLQPMLVNRMAGHTPLAGQWTILAALFLACSPAQGRRTALAWIALLAVTSLIHSYLLAMVLPLWAADWLRRVRTRGSLAELAAAPLAVGLALWCGGFFLLRGGYASGPGHDSGGYGTWNFDLLAFADGGAWSALLPDLPDPGHWEAGSSYLGLGALVLIGCGLVALTRRPVALPRRLWPLLAILLALLVFAVTPHVTIGGRGGTLVTLPGWMLSIGGALRNSERMVWPLAYALILAAIALGHRAWGGRRTGWLLLGLLTLQVVDLWPGLSRRHALVAEAPTGIPKRLFDPFWDEATRHYRQVRAVPAANMGQGWESIARFAAVAGMPTDSIYMARVNDAALDALRHKVAGILGSGRYEPGTLYVLRDAESLALARQSLDPARDALVRADDYWVLAPGWVTRGSITRD